MGSFAFCPQIAQFFFRHALKSKLPLETVSDAFDHHQIHEHAHKPRKPHGKHRHFFALRKREHSGKHQRHHDARNKTAAPQARIQAEELARMAMQAERDTLQDPKSPG